VSKDLPFGIVFINVNFVTNRKHKKPEFLGSSNYRVRERVINFQFVLGYTLYNHC
jgi:hypothetical protein